MNEVAGVIGPVKANYRLRETDLSDITPETVKNLLRGCRNGRLEDQERLYRVMFDTWPRLQKNVGEVGDAVSRLEWCVQPYAEKGQDPTPEAIKHAETCEAALWKCKPDATKWETDFVGAIKALLDAKGMGHIVLETLWQVDGDLAAPRAFCPIPAKFYAYPYYSGDNLPDQLMLRPTGLSNGPLTPFPKDRFIIGKRTRGSEHPVFGALLRCLAKWWLGSYFGWGWQLQYSQLFGIPWRTVEADGAAAIAAAQTALEDIGAAGWAVLPKGSSETFAIHSAVAGGESLPQRVVVKDADEACDVMFLGQTLTSGEGEHGTNALGNVHNAMRDDVLAGEAEWVAGVLRNQLFPAIIRLNFGEEALTHGLPFISAKMPEARDEKAIIERIEGLQRIGVELPEQWVYDQLGVPRIGAGDKPFARSAERQGELDREAGLDEEEEDPDKLEAARKGTRGKTRGGVRPSVWRSKSTKTSRT